MWFEPWRENTWCWESIYEADLAQDSREGSPEKEAPDPHLEYEYRLKGRKREKESTNYKTGLEYDPHIVKMNKHTYVFGQEWHEC